MRDSQHWSADGLLTFKYIKVNNEMKDSQLTPHALSKPGKYIKANNERFSTTRQRDVYRL